MVEPPIRVLFVGVAWPPETFIGRLIQGLSRAGVVVTIACESRPAGEYTDGVQWLHTPSWFCSAPLRAWHLARMGARTCLQRDSAFAEATAGMETFPGRGNWRASVREVYRLLPFLKRNWDVLYFPWNTGAISYRRLFSLGLPVVVSCRGAQVNIAPQNPERIEIRNGLAETFAGAAAVHCVSEAIRNEALRYGLEEKKAWIIRPAVDPEFFRPATGKRETNQTLHLVSTGSLIWRKGIEYALLGMRQLLDRGFRVRLDIIGDGVERQRVLYTVKDLRLDPHVRLLGKLPATAVRDHLQAADALLLTSLSEGISNAVLEAMACGLPVVSSDCGGMREAITEGEEGFLCPVRDVGSIAQALGRLAASDTVRREMGARARERVLREFTLDRQIQEWTTLLRSVTARRYEGTVAG